MAEARRGRASLAVGDLRCLCRPDLAGPLAEVYRRQRWVYDALAERPAARFLRGRRPVVVGALGGVPMVVKRLHHGGVLAPLTGDRFLTPRRVLTNLLAVDALLARGLPTPELLFAAWRRAGLVVRMELGFAATEGADAAAVLFGGAGHPRLGAEEVMARVGATVAALHRAGVYHRDLNLRNLLLTPQGEVWVLDVDKAKVSQGPVGPLARRRSYRRLVTSVRKLGLPVCPRGRVEALLRHMEEAYRAVYDGP